MRSTALVALVLSTLTMAARPAAAEAIEGTPIGTGLHAGANLSVRQPIVSDETDLVPALELGVLIGGRVDLYLALGLDIEREKFEDGDRESSSTAGAILPEVGARFVIGTPRPGAAFFYLGLAVTPVIGVASYSSDADDGDDEHYEDRAREFEDRFDIGILLGVEYLVAASFGIGVQAGFTTSINNLEKTDEEAPDRHIEVGFFIPFTIRAAYQW
jgi:hypothetical protein